MFAKATAQANFAVRSALCVAVPALLTLAACNPHAGPPRMRRVDGASLTMPANNGGAPSGGASGENRTGGSGGQRQENDSPVMRPSGTGGTGGALPNPEARPDQRDAGPSVADAGVRDVETAEAEPVVKYNVYLGQTHAHSDLSRATHDEFSGRDMPAAGFAKAKAKGADFYFITDHVDSSGSITPKDFQTIKTAAMAATDPTFVAAAGIEYHLDANEVNMYASDYDAAHTSVRRSSTAYLDYLLARPGAFIQWNHPLRSGLPEHKYDGLSPARDRVAALIEVLNGDDSPAAASYQKALDLGWHVAPAAGHDNHGDGWFDLPTRTGVLAAALTRDEIFEAIRQQRVYCSQDPKLKLWYEINGSIMGSTIAPAARYTVTLRTEGGARITKVEIIGKGGAVAATGVPTGNEWTSELKAQPGNFYYARLTAAASVRTWTAPIWIAAQ